MKQISKSLAEDIAKKLTEKNKKIIQDYKKETVNLCVEKYNLLIDSKTIELLQTIPDKFVNKRDYIRLKRPGIYGFSIHLWDNIKVYGNDPEIVDSEFFELIKSRQDKVEIMDDKLIKLKNQIADTIYKLRTPNRIEKEFPEAFKLLPPETGVNLPALNVTELVKQIEDFPEN